MSKKIDQVVIEIDGCPIELSRDGAMNLFNDLKKAFAQETEHDVCFDPPIDTEGLISAISDTVSSFPTHDDIKELEDELERIL